MSRIDWKVSPLVSATPNSTKVYRPTKDGCTTTSYYPYIRYVNTSVFYACLSGKALSNGLSDERFNTLADAQAYVETALALGLEEL